MFDWEEYLQVQKKYQEYMDYLKDLANKSYGVEWDSLKVEPFVGDSFTVTHEDVMDSDTDIVNLKFTPENIEAGVLMVARRYAEQAR